MQRSGPPPPEEEVWAPAACFNLDSNDLEGKVVEAEEKNTKEENVERGQKNRHTNWQRRGWRDRENEGSPIGRRGAWTDDKSLTLALPFVSLCRSQKFRLNCQTNLMVPMEKNTDKYTLHTGCPPQLIHHGLPTRTSSYSWLTRNHLFENWISYYINKETDSISTTDFAVSNKKRTKWRNFLTELCSMGTRDSLTL